VAVPKRKEGKFMSEIIKKFTADELIMEAECLEEYGEYLHVALIGYSAEELRRYADLVNDHKI